MWMCWTPGFHLDCSLFLLWDGQKIQKIWRSFTLHLYLRLEMTSSSFGSWEWSWWAYNWQVIFNFLRISSRHSNQIFPLVSGRRNFVPIKILKQRTVSCLQKLLWDPSASRVRSMHKIVRGCCYCTNASITKRDYWNGFLSLIWLLLSSLCLLLSEEHLHLFWNKAQTCDRIAKV